MFANQLRFRSNLFNGSQASPRWTSPYAYGEDLAEWLRARLQCAEYTLGKPSYAVEGWCMECRSGHESHQIRVSKVGTEQWMIEVARSRSWLASLVLPQPAMDRALADAIHAALLGEPAVREVRWIHQRQTERALAAD